MKDNELSKFLSYVLRHNPESIGIVMDYNGWVKVDDLINSINLSKSDVITFDKLVNIVETSSKQRFSFNEDKTLIRANQGHSIDVDVQLGKSLPPDELFHGTVSKYTKSIEKEGLVAKNRLYVHLSKDLQTAIEVGRRHGTPVVYKVNCKQMLIDGYEFYLSKNNVWLIKSVPSKYLSLVAL
ncbi:MAG: RNA 2'-phosphotransferase [Epulopiscium sp. Nele67-Bin004]|nr:MAG: RNA 2'-phosphotransferase [Epulopiscium sp. Nele67-Bin004]